jgi:hypothetical protein
VLQGARPSPRIQKAIRFLLDHGTTFAQALLELRWHRNEVQVRKGAVAPMCRGQVTCIGANTLSDGLVAECASVQIAPPNAW